jgi:hypothetical protein
MRDFVVDAKGVKKKGFRKIMTFEDFLTSV